MDRKRVTRPAPLLNAAGAGSRSSSASGIKPLAQSKAGDAGLQLPLLEKPIEETSCCRKAPRHRGGCVSPCEPAALLPTRSPTASVTSVPLHREEMAAAAAAIGTPTATAAPATAHPRTAPERRASRTKLALTSTSSEKVHPARTHALDEALHSPTHLPHSPTPSDVEGPAGCAVAPASARRGSHSRKLPASSARVAVPEGMCAGTSTGEDAAEERDAAPENASPPAGEASPQVAAQEPSSTSHVGALRPSSLGRSAGSAGIPPPPPGPYPGKRAGRPSRTSQPLLQNVALAANKSGIAAWMKQQQQQQQQAAEDEAASGAVAAATADAAAKDVAASEDAESEASPSVGEAPSTSSATLHTAAEHDATTVESSAESDAAAAPPTAAAVPDASAPPDAESAAAESTAAVNTAAVKGEGSESEESSLGVGSSLFNGAYTITSRLGNGTFGDVYKAAYSATGALVAIKTATSQPHIVQMKREVTAYLWCRKKSESIRLPKLHWSGPCRNQHIMILELLGSDVELLARKMPNAKFTPRTTAQLGIEMLGLLETLHTEAGCIHNDIKPANFAIKGRDLYLIDLGMTRPWQDANGEAIKYDPTAERAFCGTPRFASVNTHKGGQLSRRDDLESLLYALVYLLKGSLPWGHLSTTEEVAEAKCALVARPEALVENHPYLTPFYKSVMGLGFHDAPDYKHLAALLTKWRDRVGWKGQYDWETKTYAHLFASASEELYNTPEMPGAAAPACVVSNVIPQQPPAPAVDANAMFLQQQQPQPQPAMMMNSYPDQGWWCTNPQQQPLAGHVPQLGDVTSPYPYPHQDQIQQLVMNAQGAGFARGVRGGKKQGYVSMPPLPPLGGMPQGTPAEQALPGLGDHGSTVPSPPSTSPPPSSRRTLTGRPQPLGVMYNVAAANVVGQCGNVIVASPPPLPVTPPPQQGMYMQSPQPCMQTIQSARGLVSQQCHETPPTPQFAHRNPRSKFHPKGARGGVFPQGMANAQPAMPQNYGQPLPQQPQRDAFMIYPTPPPLVGVAGGNGYMQ